MADDPVETVRRWLKEHGYPLEYEAARTLQAAGYRTWQGLHYLDAQSDSPTAREIDVVASEPACFAAPNTTLQVVIEAKHAPEPWVVLSTELEMSAEGVVQGLIYSEQAEAILLTHARTPPLPFLLHMPKRHGFSVVQATKRSDPNRTNQAYAALYGVVKAARGRMEPWRKTKACTWAFPVIVMSGSLIQLGYNERGEESIAPILWQRVSWWGSSAQPVTVDVVQRDHFPQYVRELRASTEALGLAFKDYTSRP